MSQIFFPSISIRGRGHYCVQRISNYNAFQEQENIMTVSRNLFLFSMDSSYTEETVSHIEYIRF